MFYYNQTKSSPMTSFELNELLVNYKRSISEDTMLSFQPIADVARFSSFYLRLHE